MGNFAQTTITLTDETITSAGSNTEIPLVVFATAENKVKDEATGEIALGTTKQMAGELLTVTSRRECSDYFGVANFVQKDGTVVQGDERNEYGLHVLYDILGATNLAYALRADIDLNQLEATNVQPVGEPKNGTKWLDLSDSSFGVSVANGGSIASRAWSNVTSYIILEDGEIEKGDNKYTTTRLVTEVGQFAVGYKDGVLVYFESFADATWKEVGSKDWYDAHGSSVTTTGTFALPAENDTCTVNGQLITFTAEDIVSAETVLAKLKSVDSSLEGTIKTDADKTFITLTDKSKVITLVDGENAPLAKIGFPMLNGKAIVSTAKVFFNSAISYPDGSISGSVWFKTTTQNKGIDLTLKNYNAASKRWVSSTLPVAASLSDVEKQYSFSALSKGVKGCIYSAPLGEFSVYEFDGSTSTKITSAKTEDNIPAGSMVIKQLDKTNAIKSITIKTNSEVSKATYVSFVNNRLLSENFNGMTATLNEQGNFVLFSDIGTAITLELDEVVETALGIESGEYGHWTLSDDIVASAYSPASDANIGTLWFNDDFIVDIMVTDGNKWVGYKNMYNDASIFVQSAEPASPTDNSLWIDPSAASYPMLKRFYNGEWELVDLTDQTSPLGCVFAQLRSDAGYQYSGSSHTAYSTNLADLMVSDYVDPDAVDPRSYPAGMLCFNTRCSTNNVKRFEDIFADAAKEIGATFKVGESEDFATPGTSSNPKTTRWVVASGNNADGSGIFGKSAQRKMVVDALTAAIVSSEEARNENYDIFYAACPGYPELDNELQSLNADRKNTFLVVTDTPKALKANGTAIQNWANNANNAVSHGEEGRVSLSAYQTRAYPPMGLGSNADGLEVAVPTSCAKLRDLIVAPRGQIAAGVNYGTVTNLASVGYIDEEGEYTPVQIASSGLGPVITSLNMNPILARRNTGLMFWGENTENSYQSALSDEHAILTICRLKRKLDEACTPFFFRINNDATVDDFTLALQNILNDFVGSGEVNDYVLVTDESVNTPARRQNKELWADVAVNFSTSVTWIYIPIRAVTNEGLNR